jgi:hypothetical protein
MAPSLAPSLVTAGRAGACHVHLVDGEVAIIDSDDAQLVGRFRWRRTITRPTDPVYARARSERRWIKMHSLLIQTGPGLMVDHINGDGLDNRRVNLRIATRQENNFNRAPFARNRSGFKGVHLPAGSRSWTAAIKVNGRSRYLGCFPSAEEAARAYDAAAASLFGEFAWLNFPREVA